MWTKLLITWWRIDLRYFNISSGISTIFLLLFATFLSFYNQLHMIRVVGSSFVPDPTPLMEIRAFATRIEAELAIALIFISLISLIYFFRSLLPTPENLFLLSTPVLRWKLYLAILIYPLMINLVLFSVFTLPSLILMGVRAGAGAGLFFLALLLVIPLFCLTSTLIGALMALLPAYLTTLLPVLGRILLSYARILFPTLVLFYLFSTFLFPLKGYLARGVFPSYTPQFFFAEPLVISYSLYPFQHFPSLLLYLLSATGLSFLLLSLFLFTYNRMGRLFSFEVKGNSSNWRWPRVVFPTLSWPLLRKDLSMLLRDPALLVTILNLLLITFGAMFALQLLRLPTGNPVDPHIFIYYVLIMVISIIISQAAFRTFEGEKKTFLLLRSSPLPAFSLVFYKFLGAFIYTLVILLGLITLMSAISLFFKIYLNLAAILTILPFLILSLLFPLAGLFIWLASGRFTITLHQRAEAVPTLSLETLLKSILPTFALLYPSYLVWLRFNKQVLILYLVALILFIYHSGMIYILLRLAAKKLERIEWCEE